MGRKKQQVESYEGNVAFIFLYRTYRDFVIESETIGDGESDFDLDIHRWIEKEYKVFRKKRANAIKGLELNKEFSKAYPYIKRNAFHLDEISQLNWELERRLYDRKEYQDYSSSLAVMINENNNYGLIATDIWNYVTPLIRQYREYELNERVKRNVDTLRRCNEKLGKKKDVIDKALEFITTRKGAKKKFTEWLDEND